MDGAILRKSSIGALVGAIWIAGVYAASPLIGEFPLVALAEGIIIRSPGWLSTLAISLLGFYAKPVLVGALVVAVVLSTGVVAAFVPMDSSYLLPFGVLVAIVSTSALFLTMGSNVSLSFVVAVAVAIVPALIVARAMSNHHPSRSRRAFLKRFGSVALAGVVSLSVLRGFFGRIGGQRESERASSPLERTVSIPKGDQAFDFRGMPSAVTPPEEHYVVDITINPPLIDADAWTLDIGGEVAQPYRLGYDELLNHDAVIGQTTTMICISNQIGGDLIGTAHWTGVQLSDLVAAAEPTAEAVDVVTHAADGYREAIPIELVEREDIIVAFGMGERTLAVEHGFPARLIIPGRYGMKMTKWIDRIEIADREHEAYWEQRGWDEEAIVNTMSYIRGAHRDGDHVVIGGVAFGGLETGVAEIAAVEVSVDDGASWNEATLEAQLDPHAWRRWRYEFADREQSEFDVIVRAIKRDGSVQTDEESSPRPSGATGWHRKTIQV